MADKRIQDLPAATSVQTADRFVLEQSGAAKSLTGQILINDLATALDGHGGINDISYTAPTGTSLTGTVTITLADGTTETYTVKDGKGISSVSKTGTSGLTDTYTIAYNNGTTNTFTVSNGRGITGITWSESGTTGDGKTHTGTIAYNDGTTSTIVFNDGSKGDTGAQTYVHIKWADEMPTQDSDMSDNPAPWIGFYSGLSATAPTEYTDYSWYEYKGETGDTGNGISNITRTASVGLVDTYTVSMTDGTSYDFTVTNGSGISNISAPTTAGLVDTYTITCQDGSSYTFNVTNGNGISNIAKTNTSGLVDTYTVTTTNGNTYTFNVTNAKSIVSVVMTGGTHAAGTTDTYTITYNNGDTSTFTVYNGTNGTGSVSSVSGIQAVNGDVPQVTSGNGAPTPSTVGQLNQLYLDLNESVLYVCLGENDGSYGWAGTTVTVDSALSTTSTNPVQNSVITNKVGTVALNTTATDLSSAVNEVLTAIPDATSDLTNDSGFITASGAPVQSVNGATGAVTMAQLMYKDVSSASSYPSNYGMYAVIANIFSNMTPQSYYGVLTIEGVGSYQRHLFTSSQNEVWEGWREAATVAEPSNWERLGKKPVLDVYSSPSGTTLTNNAWGTLKSVTFSAGGTYIVSGGAVFANNSTGFRSVAFSTGSDATNASQTAMPRIPAVSGSTTILSFSTAYTFTTNQTMNLVAFQNSGGDLSVSSWNLRVLRLF